MKALKSFTIAMVVLFVLATTLAFKSSAFSLNTPLYFNINHISNFAVIAKSTVTNSEDSIRDGLQNDYLQQIFADILDLKSSKIGEIINKFARADQN